VTNECRERITSSGEVEGGRVEIDPMVRVLGGQAVLSGDDDDGEEIEDTITAALRVLCSDLLVDLEKPDIFRITSVLPPAQCKVVKEEYHAFLEATTKFIWEIQQRQLLWRWSAESGVYGGVSWMQGLWASRKSNSQNRSFIEQQMSMYSGTGCFDDSKEILKRDVEVVEFLNDLLDTFG